MTTKPKHHGGARPGAGRPKKDRTPGPTRYASAIDYLSAVVRGDEPADNTRVLAARALLPYQAPRERAPVRSRTPGELQNLAAAAEVTAEQEAWRVKSDAIRKRHGRST